MNWISKRNLRTQLAIAQLDICHWETMTELYKQQCQALRKQLDKALMDAAELRTQIIQKAVTE